MRVLIITNRFPRPGHMTDATYNGSQVDGLAANHDLRAIVPVAWTERLRDLMRGAYAGRATMHGTVRLDLPTYWFVPRLFEGRYGRCYYRSIRGAVRRVGEEFAPDGVVSGWAR